jgi:hypothetical protein
MFKPQTRLQVGAVKIGRRPGHSEVPFQFNSFTQLYSLTCTKKLKCNFTLP